MSLFDFLKSKKSSNQDNPKPNIDMGYSGYSIDQHYPGISQYGGTNTDPSSNYYLDIEVLKTTAPIEGWGAWCEWVAEIGKIARIIRTESQNCMMFKLASTKSDEDPEIKEFRQSLQFSKLCKDISKYLRIYGKCFIFVEYHEDPTKGIKSAKHLYPRSIKVYRNHRKDFDDLLEILQDEETSVSSMDPFYNLELTGSGDIIAFVQTIRISPTEKKYVVFAPDELIFIPREPSFVSPDGVPLIQENYMTIIRKLKSEHSAGIMIERHGDPPMVLTVPEKWWNKRNAIRSELRLGVKQGLNMIFPDGTEHKIPDTRGSPEGVIKSQKHIEKEFTSGMGFADSFTDSENSNRSIGDLHLIFYERDLVGEREMIADIIEPKIIDKHFSMIGYGGKVSMEFEDLTPPDEGYIAYVLAPLVPQLSRSQIRKYFQKVGIPVSEDELDDLCKRLYESAKNPPPGSPIQKSPPTRPKTE